MGRRAARFTAAQDEILRQHYRKLGPTRIGVIFGMRPERVYRRAALLGLVRLREGNWTPEEDDVLFARYPDGGAPACGPHLPGRSRGGITGRAVALGIHYRAVDAAHDHRALAAALGGCAPRPLITGARLVKRLS